MDHPDRSTGRLTRSFAPHLRPLCDPKRREHEFLEEVEFIIRYSGSGEVGAGQ